MGTLAKSGLVSLTAHLPCLGVGSVRKSGGAHKEEAVQEAFLSRCAWETVPALMLDEFLEQLPENTVRVPATPGTEDKEHTLKGDIFGMLTQPTHILDPIFDLHKHKHETVHPLLLILSVPMFRKANRF